MNAMKRIVGTSRTRKDADRFISGVARLDSHPMHLARRLRRGEIAIVDVMDLDQRTAEALASARPAAVLNASTSISGRFPAGGAKVLVDAGIPLVDALGVNILGIRDGDRVRIEGAEVFQGTDKIAEGVRQSPSDIGGAMESAAKGAGVHLASFAASVLDSVDRDALLLLDGAGLPRVETRIDGLQVVILSTGFGHTEQLRQIRPFLRDRRPLIIAVGAAADEAMRDAYAPKVIVGNVEGISEAALTSGAEVVLHEPGQGDGGARRLDSLNVRHVYSDVSVSSEDLAILLAHHAGASLIVTVGVASGLADFLEEGRPEAAATFLARLVAGGRLADASTVAALYRHRYSPWTLIALVLAALFALGNALALTPGGAAWLRDVWPVVASWFGATA
jgi:uncharacterized membrane-anchored protein